MADLKHLTKLREKVTEMQSEADRAQGALESILTRLKKEFKCNSVAEAEALLEKCGVEIEEIEEEYADALVLFEKKWGDILK